jgi:aerobic carbon-monoxide dehydrogenase medium subunit
VKPPPLEYKRATSVSHALALLRELGDEAKAVAGGQSLIPLLNLRLARPSVLIDINDIEADDLDVVDGCLITGALVRHCRLCSEDVVTSAHPLLAHSARFIGHSAIRNRGTVGGSLAHSDAAAELPLVAVACEARIVVASTERVRETPAHEFFVGPFMSDLAPDELVLTVQWPTIGERDLWGFAEIAERAGDFAMAAAAIKISVDEAGTRRPVVAVGGLGATPRRLPAAEEVLRSGSWAEHQLREAVRDVLASHDSPDVDGAVPEYTGHLVTEMVTRAAWQSR